MYIIEKPWGREEVIELNDRYLVKRLTMLKGKRCSLQYHRVKRETIYVLNGQLRIVQGPTADQLVGRVYGPGETVTLAPGVMHRMEGVTESVYLEASTPDMEDVVRIDDDYQRAGK